MPHVDLRGAPLGQDPRQILGDAAAGDVRQPFHASALEQRPDRPADTSGAARAARRRPSRPAPGRMCRAARPATSKKHAPGERIAVGVQAGGRQADQHVAGHDRPAVDDLASVDDADDEAGEVVLAVGVEARHLGGLAADQRAAVLAARRARRPRRPARPRPATAAGGEVVEEEQRLGALDEDVVDAVVDEVGADRVVPAGHERDLELGADAVGARDQHRLAIPVAIEAEQAAERSDVREHAGRERRPRQRPDAADGLVAGVDVDASLAVVHQKSSLPIRVCIERARVGDPSGESQ